jgi:molybdenum cofactor cytidylyltransferase
MVTDPLSVTSVALVLAAGSSSRMKQSKQLLKIGETSLLHKTTQTALDSGVDTVVVVLGANHEEHAKELSDVRASVIFNSGWQGGMGSSLKAGIKVILERFPATDFVLVLVCDQPLLTAAHLRNLMAPWKAGGRPIVASYYSGSAGVPVLFHRSLFNEILLLPDDQGAKKIVAQHERQADFVDFPEGAIDLDTPEDWKNFQQRLGEQ